MYFKLKTKAALFQMLDLLPVKVGYFFYHYFQEKFGNQSINSKVQSTKASYQTLQKIAEELKFDFRKKKVLEIGSGWLPLMPYYFKFLGGAREVFTLDVNRHYNARKIGDLNKIFSNENRVVVEGNSPYNLPEGISYFPNSDVSIINELDADFVFSRFVLEHVTPLDLKLMHEKFRQNLGSGTYISHFISPSDHRAYVDKTLSLQDFLRFSEKEWNKQQTKFDYHNRWRLPQYLDLFRSAGLEILYLNYDTPTKDSEAYMKFKKLKLHPDFQVFSEEELTAGSIHVVLKVP